MPARRVVLIPRPASANRKRGAFHGVREVNLLTTAQAAKRLGVSVSSIRRLTLAGVLKCAVAPSERVRLYRLADVEAARARPKVGNPTFGRKKRRRLTPRIRSPRRATPPAACGP